MRGSTKQHTLRMIAERKLATLSKVVKGDFVPKRQSHGHFVSICQKTSLIFYMERGFAWRKAEFWEIHGIIDSTCICAWDPAELCYKEAGGWQWNYFGKFHWHKVHTHTQQLHTPLTSCLLHKFLSRADNFTDPKNIYTLSCLLTHPIPLVFHKTVPVVTM